MKDSIFDKYLTEASQDLFFSKGDPNDPRLGEIVKKAKNEDDLKGAKIVIIGIPDDIGIKRNKGRPGAAGAPTAVRRNFYKLTPGCFNDDIAKMKIVDAGDVKIEGEDIEKTHKNVEAVVRRIAEYGAIPVCIGGGHDFDHPNVAGVIDAYGSTKGNFGVVNVDSHFDVRDMSFGITSGTPHYRTLELSGSPVEGKNFVEFGIQEHHNSKTHYNYLKGKKATVMTLGEIQDKGPEAMMKKALGLAGKSTKHVCVSFDIDATRMADVPGASASYPNGFSARDMERFAYMSGRDGKVRMTDILEICPPLDKDDMTAKLGASMMFYFIKGVSERSSSAYKK